MARRRSPRCAWRAASGAPRGIIRTKGAAVRRAGAIRQDFNAHVFFILVTADLLQLTLRNAEGHQDRIRAVDCHQRYAAARRHHQIAGPH